MFVRDEAPDWAYVQLMKSYKADPASLMRELPHRDEATLNTVAQNLTVILWRDFAEPGLRSRPGCRKYCGEEHIGPENLANSDSLMISCFN